MQSTEEIVHCFVCEAACHDGLDVSGMRLCLSCERRIVQSDVNDADYDDLVAGLHRFWRATCPIPDVPT